ncbi:hypothetical protein BkAM31D_03980 [Halalkalibacter krulwichiae]|uniref:Uncharacterized protein n=2 Tax=Halalkalibacter krulwichiae TaxID=199441 RepID=A0A1X9M8R4_9BACI|nr:hypothetical protein BkAM31D_03980 [Halalkalibacter krulwichiae]
MKKVISVFMIVVILIIGTFLFSKGEGNTEEADLNETLIEEEQREFGVVEEELNEVTDSIYSEVSKIVNGVHDVLNKITGFDSHERYIDPDSEFWDSAVSRMETQIRAIERTIEFAEGDVKADLEDFVKITKIAIANHDHQALIYSHRIIHDVDTMYNGLNKKVFNAARLSNRNEETSTIIQSIIDEASL